MHLHRILLEAVARGELSQERLWEIVKEHLIAICPDCGEALAAHETGLGWTEPADPVERLGRRLGLGERQLREEVRVARAWVRELLRLDPGERRGKVWGATKRFRGSLFGTLLLEEARRAIPENPEESLSLAEVALVSCERTRPHDPDPAIQAAALAVQGNAKRALGRLGEAEEDLERARRLLDARGLSEPAVPAEIQSYLGSLRKDQGRLEEASQHLRRAGDLYHLLRDRRMAAQALLILGSVHYRLHEVQAAVGVVEKALTLLSDERATRLRAYAHHNLALYLHAQGDVDRAEEELATHENVLAHEDAHLHRVTWLRARIAWSREDLPKARRLFAESRAAALELGRGYEAGLLCLEEALVHLAEGRTPRVKKLAEQALRHLSREEEVERETRAALALLVEAARREELTRRQLERTITTLEAARHAHPVR